MNNILLLTASEVRGMCRAINGEIEDGIIEDAILSTQQMVVRPSIGKEWYDEIILQKSGGTYSIENKVIVEDYLKWIISYSTWQHLVVTLSLQLNAAGLRIKTSDHSSPAESSDLAFTRSFIQNLIDGTRREMFRYIDEHESSYPLYFNNKYGEKPKNNQFGFDIGVVSKNNTKRI